MAATREINWTDIELAYRSGILPLRDIAKEHSITHGGNYHARQAWRMKELQ